jgi:hypothetical protein
MALGADARRVSRMVLVEGLGVAAVGVGLGLAAGFRLFLFTPRDSLVFVPYR